MNALSQLFGRNKAMPPPATPVHPEPIPNYDSPQPTPTETPLANQAATASQERLMPESREERSVGTETQQAQPPLPQHQQQYPPPQQPYPPYNNGQYYANQGYYHQPYHQAIALEKPDTAFEQLYSRRTWTPIFTYLTALAMLGMLIYELVRNHQLTGSVIQLSPFNIMIGPSAQTLIQTGARYVPCMRPSMSPFSPTDVFQCPNTTSIGQTVTAPTLRPVAVNVTLLGPPCSLQEVCGMWDFRDPLVPNQGYRFVTAIFVHSGVIHFLCNMIVHLSLGASMERIMNPLRYAIVWLAAGTFGFIFGGVFAPVGNASVGCSGALFGVVALLFIDLFQSWRYVIQPGWELTKLIFLILISFAFGLLPGLDNFAHIGGFVCGLLAGVVFLPAIRHSRTYMIILWIVRAVALAGLAAIFYVLIDTFYKGKNPEEICSWCKYLACLPIADMCESYHS